jgi:hypothetical protein
VIFNVYNLKSSWEDQRSWLEKIWKRRAELTVYTSGLGDLFVCGTVYCRLDLMLLPLRHASLLAVKCMS